MGRFAPTPNGPLHFGSLVAAVASYLVVKSVSDGVWRLRFDDLDTLRVKRFHEDTICRQLETMGLHWDDSIVRQSEHTAEYSAVAKRLFNEGRAFFCRCSRKTVEENSLRRNSWGEPLYAGTCSKLALERSPQRSLRVKAPLSQEAKGEDSPIRFFDVVLKREQTANWREEIGSFVVFRADGVCSYHLANAIDDDRMKITHATRGSDLLPSAFRQMVIAEHAGLVVPEFGHVPVVCDSDGHKLGKSRFSPEIRKEQAAEWMHQALRYLGQEAADAQAPAPVQLSNAVRQFSQIQLAPGPIS